MISTIYASDKVAARLARRRLQMVSESYGKFILVRIQEMLSDALRPLIGVDIDLHASMGRVVGEGVCP